ncbi:MAG: hypothetical protein ACSLFR_03460 [Solirubrobacteraceae bacterium]
MIYCVVPQEMAPELLAQLEEYYADDPNVKVIVDRRSGERRGPATENDGPALRVVRDRRRPRVIGEFPPVDPPAA